MQDFSTVELRTMVLLQDQETIRAVARSSRGQSGPNQHQIQTAFF